MRYLFSIILVIIPSLASIGQQVYLHTAQDVYSPGSTVNYKVYLDQEPDPADGLAVQFLIVNADGGIVQQNKALITKSTRSGSFDLSIAIPDGFYRLLALPEGEVLENAFNKKIQIRALEIPGVLIDLEESRQVYKSGQEVRVMSRFYSPDGTGMKRLRYSWKLLVAGQVVEQGAGRADKAGEDVIEFTYPGVEPNSLVSLEVLVDYYGNSYQTAVILPSVSMPALISFFPEGGLLINGYETQVGIQSLTLYGDPLAVSGRILDDSGQEILQVSSGQSGYGLFTLRPDDSKPLQLIVDQPVEAKQTIDLPAIRSNGLVLRYEGLDNGQFQFSASNPVKDTYMSLTAKAFQYGKEKYSKRMLVQTDKLFSLSQDLFEAGLVQLLVYNDRDELMAGRIIVNPKAHQGDLPDFDSGSLSIVDAVFCPGLNPEIPLDLYFNKQPGLPIGLDDNEEQAYLLYALSEFQLADESAKLSDRIELLFRQSNTEQFISRIRKLRSDQQRLLDQDLGFFDYFTKNKAHFDQFNMLPQKLSPEERVQRMLDQGKPVLSVIRSIRAYRLVNNQLVFRGGSDSFNDIGGAVIVVDGIPKGADIGVIENMSPHDVASIKISTSISDIMRYSGMEDTAGVVVIETRKASDAESVTETEDYAPFNPLILWDPNMRSNEDPEIPLRKINGPVRVSRVSK